MRVVGGEWRGRPLAAPAGRGVRPTSDKVREAMFDVLLALPEVRAGGDAVPAAGPLGGHVVLDLFAGSGALGIEALSRGAGACTFVEHERAALRALRANLERLGVTVGARDRREEGDDGRAARARVLAADARRALRADARRGARYTLLFADPPYDRYAEVRPALARLLGPLLAPRAVLVIETAAGTAAGLPWTIVREKRYGDTRVTFLVAADTSDDEGADADDDRPVT
ncbi:MAG: RsmD family RNA methyltransferase [Actinobacteria bacterium]|nr:RsmD family RNA methyltransferase [Actinomycetota bacterium]